MKDHREAFRRDWGDEPSEGPAWPEPVVAQREARSDEIPPAAARLAQKAREVGWAVSVVYSRGTSAVGSAWTPGPLTEAVSVRCRRGEGPSDERAVGYWRCPARPVVGKPKWAWEFGLAKSSPMGVREVGSRELAALLGERPSDEPRRGDDLSDGS